MLSLGDKLRQTGPHQHWDVEKEQAGAKLLRAGGYH